MRQVKESEKSRSEYEQRKKFKTEFEGECYRDESSRYEGEGIREKRKREWEVRDWEVVGWVIVVKVRKNQGKEHRKRR
jgi:hypothetical protein